MGTMVVVLVIVAVVVVGVVVAKVAWRPEDEVGSVESYHRALGTIEHLAMGNAAPVRTAPDSSRGPERLYGSPGDPSPYRDPSGADPVRRSTPDDSDGAPRREEGPASADERLDDPRPGTRERPLVFDDAALIDDPLAVGGDTVAPRFRSKRARRVAMASMDHGSRRWSGIAAVAAVVVLVVAAAAVYEGSQHHSSATADRRTASAGASNAARHPASTTRVSPARSRHTGTTRKKRSHPATSTAPTTPTQLVASSSSPTAAVYPVPTGAYQVTLAATGPCWVDARATSTGSTVWTGTMEAGQSEVLSATGPLAVEIGSTAATLSMNGEPVVLPTPLQAPFVATFEPGAAS